MKNHYSASPKTPIMASAKKGNLGAIKSFQTDLTNTVAEVNDLSKAIRQLGLEIMQYEIKRAVEQLSTWVAQKRAQEPKTDWIVRYDKDSKIMIVSSRDDKGAYENLHKITLLCNPGEINEIKSMEKGLGEDEEKDILNCNERVKDDEYPLEYLEQLLLEIQQEDPSTTPESICPCGEVVEMSKSQTELVDFTVVDYGSRTWGSGDIEKIFTEANFKPSPGDIIMFGDYKPGDCERVVKGNQKKEEEKIEPIIGQLRLKSEQSNSGMSGIEPEVQKKGDHIRIHDTWQDRFFYPHDQFTTPDVQRHDFSTYLKKQGILTLIANFLIDLEEMELENLPEAENLMAFFLRNAGYEPLLDWDEGILREKELRVNEKDETLARIDGLIYEKEELCKRLDKYECFYPVYESKNPNNYVYAKSNEPYIELKKRFWGADNIEVGVSPIPSKDKPKLQGKNPEKSKNKHKL